MIKIIHNIIGKSLEHEFRQKYQFNNLWLPFWSQSVQIYIRYWQLVSMRVSTVVQEKR